MLDKRVKFKYNNFTKRGYRASSPKKTLYNTNICLHFSIKIDKRSEMEEDKGKKYRYTYYTATGKEEIEVDEKWYEILRQEDRDIYNNNRREEYKSYHLTAYPNEINTYTKSAWWKV